MISRYFQGLGRVQKPWPLVWQVNDSPWLNVIVIFYPIFRTFCGGSWLTGVMSRRHLCLGFKLPATGNQGPMNPLKHPRVPDDWSCLDLFRGSHLHPGLPKSGAGQDFFFIEIPNTPGRWPGWLAKMDIFSYLVELDMFENCAVQSLKCPSCDSWGPWGIKGSEAEEISMEIISIATQLFALDHWISLFWGSQRGYTKTYHQGLPGVCNGARKVRALQSNCPFAWYCLGSTCILVAAHRGRG